MKKTFLLIFGIILISLSIISAAQMNSSNYKINSVISKGGDNLSSNNYKSEVISGMVVGNLSSSSYKQLVGFIFNVIVGTPLSAAPPIPRGGESGRATPKIVINKDLIKVKIKQGENYREIIEINNTNNYNRNITLIPDENIKKFMIINEENFILAPEESKLIFIDIFAKDEEIRDIYTGRITARGERGETKIINVIIEIKERKPLFDMIVNLISKEVAPGRDVRAKIKISNLGDLNHMDISIYSAIKDFNGNVFSFKEESIAIDKELEIIRSLRVPKDIPFGMYMFYSRVDYKNISASSTDTFEVIERGPINIDELVILGGIILLLIILIFKLRKKSVYEEKKTRILREIKKKENRIKSEKKREYAKKRKRKIESSLKMKNRKKYKKKYKKEKRKIEREIHSNLKKKRKSKQTFKKQIFLFI